jgi:hypothetical protein
MTDPPHKDLSAETVFLSGMTLLNSNRSAWLPPVKWLLPLLQFFLANTFSGNVMAGETSSAEQIRIHGMVIDGGIVCPLLTTESGDRFPLMGIRKNEYPTGTWLDLTGKFIRFSTCQQGERAFSVETVKSTCDSGKRAR